MKTELTRDDLLVLLIEECGEVIQAATKCLRFGYNRDFPGYGQNGLVLAKEFGEMMAVAGALDLDDGAKASGMASKLARASEAKAKYGV